MTTDETTQTREGGTDNAPYVLAVLLGDDARYVTLPASGTLVFGRASACDVSCDHPSISREHARLYVEGADVRVEDLGGRNGTLVRGARIAKHAPTHVAPGDLVECGEAMLLLRRGVPAASRPSHGLDVGPEARWFRREGEEAVQLGRRAALRLILDALTERRLAPTVRGLSLEEVFAAGWPGEKARADSAAARVYTSVQRLRALGLEGVLLLRDDGYVLSPDVPVCRVSTL